MNISQSTEEQASTLEETSASVEAVSAAARENANIAAQGRKPQRMRRKWPQRTRR